MQVTMHNLTVSVPMPIFVIVEDVGWWQGRDGSAENEPFRNGFSRRHCLDDYRALAHLAQRLKMKIALGMVLGEWDRANILRGIAGATWMGDGWDNRLNVGPWLDDAAEFLRDHRDWLEIACHGLCHEFWRNGRMERSEFHDQDCRMRPRDLVTSHLDAFARLLDQNKLPGFPRLFLPPALLHSFGNGEESIQAILYEYGVQYVITAFSRARRYAEPLHEKITWECDVWLLERGLAPVPWHIAAASPAWDFHNPILPLHWSNLLHHDPARNSYIVDGWAEMLEKKALSMNFMLAADLSACWSQAAAHQLVTLSVDAGKIIIDLGKLPLIPGFNGSIFLKILGAMDSMWQCRGARIDPCHGDPAEIQTLVLRPLPGQAAVELARV